MIDMGDFFWKIGASYEFGEYSGASELIKNTTAEHIKKLNKDGYHFIIGNNPFLDQAKKWRNHNCIRVSQVNSRTHGYCIRTIWAVKEL